MGYYELDKTELKDLRRKVASENGKAWKILKLHQNEHRQMSHISFLKELDIEDIYGEDILTGFLILLDDVDIELQEDIDEYLGSDNTQQKIEQTAIEKYHHRLVDNNNNNDFVKRIRRTEIDKSQLDR